MNRSFSFISIWCAALAAICSPLLAQGGFTLPQPELSVVKPCVLENRGDLEAAAQCYASFDSVCFDKWFEHYSSCLPQEVAYWRKALNREVQRAGAGEALSGIGARMAAACPSPNAKYRQVCEARYLRDNTVLLHIQRVWREASSN